MNLESLCHVKTTCVQVKRVCVIALCEGLGFNQITELHFYHAQNGTQIHALHSKKWHVQPQEFPRWLVFYYIHHKNQVPHVSHRNLCNCNCFTVVSSHLEWTRRRWSVPFEGRRNHRCEMKNLHEQMPYKCLYVHLLSCKCLTNERKVCVKLLHEQMPYNHFAPQTAPEEDLWVRHMVGYQRRFHLFP